MHKFEACEKEKIKKLLNTNYPFLSNVQIMQLFKSKDIKVNGKRIKEDLIVNPNDQIEVYFDFEKFLKSKIEIVFCDDNIIIANKCQGIETTSENTNHYTLETFVKTINKNAKAVHRLDTNTKGLVLLALNEKIEDELIVAFKKHYIEKEYNAICYSEKPIKPTTFTDYLAFDNYTQSAKITTKNAGKVAILEILQVLPQHIDNQQLNNLYLLKIKLKTGRTHQIRAQLNSRQIYVLGDGKYGNKEINRTLKKDKQYLCATKLTFNFPSTHTLSYLNDIKVEIEPNFKI